MYTLAAVFVSHIIGFHRRRPLYPFICLILMLMVSVATPLVVQGADTDAVDRVNELHETVPTIEDKLRQDEGRWSLKRGISNAVFFEGDSLHLRSRTTDKDKPYLTMTQSDLAADALLVEVEARHVRGSLFNGFGFYLMQAPGDYIFFYISNDGYAAIQHTALNNQEILIPWQESSAIQTQSHATNQLGLLVEGGRATLFANDNEVATINGLAIEGATLGLVTTAYEESIVEVAFSNLRYWNLDDLAPTAAQLATAGITLDDLPDGFERVPKHKIQPLLEDSILEGFEEDGSVEVMSSFGFLHPDPTYAVIGASGSIVTPINGLITYVVTTMSQEKDVEVLEIEQIGDESSAFVISGAKDDELSRLEVLIFRRDQTIALLMVGYADGVELLVTLEELAQVWDARLADLPQSGSIEVEDADYLEQGKTLLEQSKWQQATESLTQAIELDPTNAEAYYYRGLAHYQLGVEEPDHYVMAVEDLTHAMESEDFFVRASTVLNKVNQVADAELLLATYSEQVENSDNPAAAYARRGIVYRDRLGDYEMAIADLTQAIELATEFQRGDYYAERAVAHSDNGNAEAAIEDATKAIKDDHTTDICSAYAYRGAEYAKLGNYEEAEADLKRARTNCSDDAETLAFVNHQLGIVRYYRGEIEDALSLFTQAIDNQAEAARRAARESWESDFASESEEDFEEVITYFETLVAEHQLRAWREGKLEPDYAEYMSMLEAYDEIYARAARTYDWRGSIYIEQTEYDLATNDYTIAIELDPTDTSLPYWYVQRGWIYYNQDNFDAAMDDLTTAITLGRSDSSEMATAHNLLGLLADEEGNSQEAIAHYSMAISIRPDNDVFYYNRALTYYDLEDYESAIADFEMVLELSEDTELREEAEEWISDLD